MDTLSSNITYNTQVAQKKKMDGEASMAPETKILNLVKLKSKKITFPLLPKRIVCSNLNVSSVFFLDNLCATEKKNVVQLIRTMNDVKKKLDEQLY